MSDDAPGRYRAGETALLVVVREAEPLVGRWRRRFTEIVPHLTVAHSGQAPVLDEIEAALGAGLPVGADVASVSLFVSDGDRWRRHGEFPLRG